MEGMAKKVRKSKEYRKPSQFVEQQGEALDRKLNKHNVQSTSHENKSNPMLLISAGLVISLFLFIYLHGMALSQMSDLSNGLSMPDQRVFGYTVEDIEALRSVHAVIHPLDSAPPDPTAGLVRPAGLRRGRYGGEFRHRCLVLRR